jgi:hypothetical protein
MARVRLAGGWHIVISMMVLGGIEVVAIATVWLPSMGSRGWRLHCSSSWHVCSVDDDDDNLGEGGRGFHKLVGRGKVGISRLLARHRHQGQ